MVDLLIDPFKVAVGLRLDGVTFAALALDLDLEGVGLTFGSEGTELLTSERWLVQCMSSLHTR